MAIGCSFIIRCRPRRKGRCAGPNASNAARNRARRFVGAHRKARPNGPEENRNVGTRPSRLSRGPARSRSASRSRPGSETTPEAPPDFCPEPQPAPRTFSRVAPDALASHLPRNRPAQNARLPYRLVVKSHVFSVNYPPRFLPALSATPRKAHPPLQRLPSSNVVRPSAPTYPPSDRLRAIFPVPSRGALRDSPPAQSPLRPSVQSLRLRARTAPQLFRSRRYSSLFPKIDENLDRSAR